MSTYAVIESGGKQYKVERGSSLLVDRLSAAQGEKVALRAVMFRDADVVLAPAELAKVKVEATVAEHLRGPKVKVFKYKPKKGYRRRAGHRSELTRLEVTELKMGAPKAEPKAAEAAAEKPLVKEAAGKPKPRKPAKPKAGKPAAGKAEKAAKPAVRKAAKPRKPKPAARKPAAEKDSDDGA
jgi:large subunit ribosomal protein L21